MGAAGFWDDQERAQATVARLKALRRTLEPLQDILCSLDDLEVILEVAEEEEDGEAAAEFEAECAALDKALSAFEFQRMLDGPDDRRNAYLSIHAGAGGTESCDWVEMLLRMYGHWCEPHRYKQEIVELLRGDEAGIRRVTVHVIGEWAYGYLRAEVGIHRLVRISPFDSNKRRHTSFAAVDVVPEVDEDVEIEILDKDLRLDFFRAAGAGGQHVNKTSSAVRLTHVPTGVVVQCQSERSQHQNRHTAMKMLRARLYQLREKERRAEIEAAYDAKGEIAWGNQIRSYVLQPYTLVKDLRSGLQTSNVGAVLDGDIDPFIEAYLRSRIRGVSAA